MPLLSFDLIRGSFGKTRSKRILDVTHDVMVKAFNVPERDRYQIVSRGIHHPEWSSRDTGPRYRAKPAEHGGSSSHDPPSQSYHEASVLHVAGGEVGCLHAGIAPSDGRG